MTVQFWVFSKRKNSTARPATAAAYTFNCTLKDASGVLRPTLEIYQSQSFNPAQLNYAFIPSYGRYYFVTDWEWIVGRWELTLQVDALASYKTQIGNAEKYVLRAAAEYDKDIIDTFYPTIERVNVSWTGYNFPWYNNFTNGRFVLGVINGEGTALAGTTDYFILSPAELRDFMTYLFPSSVVNDWTSLNSITEQVYKSIYDPLQFIVSCKYFPFTMGGVETDAQIAFGNFVSTKYAEPLGKPNTWPIFQHDYTISANWLTRDAKDKSEPYTRLCFFLNPFGVVEISTADFTLTDTVRVRITPDLISGEAVLQIFALISGSEVLVAQQTAMIGFDVNLTAVNRDLFSAVSAVIGGASGSGIYDTLDTVLPSVLTSAGNALVSLIKPSISASTRGTPSIANIDGTSRLYVRRHLFTDEKNDEFGKPLYKNRVISTLGATAAQSGYIKCGDGDISLPAFPEEVDEVSNYLTGGFYYE